METPTISESDLLTRAEAFAQNLVTRLDKFNEENRRPTMDPEAWGRFQGRYKNEIPPPTPQQMIEVFKKSFCRYMESRYGIVP